jgi:hypothetical protein
VGEAKTTQDAQEDRDETHLIMTARMKQPDVTGPRRRGRLGV